MSILLLLLKVSLTRYTILNQQFIYNQYFEDIILLILDFIVTVERSSVILVIVFL